MALSLPGGWKEGQHAQLMLFARDLRDPQQRRQRLFVKPWSCVKDIKDYLQPLVLIPATRQRLFYSGKELKNFRTLQECGIYRDGATIWYTIARQQAGDEPMIHTFGEQAFPVALLKVIHQV